MSRTKLTAGRIREFQCPPGKQQAFLRDTETPGLGVRATANARAFIFQSKLKDGTTIRRTIGDVRAWSIDEARAEARRLQILLDQGIDPREQDREREEAKKLAEKVEEAAKVEVEVRRRYSLHALCEAYCELLESKDKKQSARQARSIFKCHVFEPHADMSALPAKDITSHHVAQLIRDVANQGKDRAAGILRSYLSAAFNAARKAAFNPKLPSSLSAFNVETNPVEPVSTIAVQRGNRTLSVAELKGYLNELSDNNISDQALKLALFAGGQRMAQLLRAKISDYDDQSKVLRLWDTKGRRSQPREHMIPLAPLGAAIVECLALRARTLGTSSFFSSFGKKQLVETTPGKRVASICKKMGCEPFDLRDVRRTCETMLASIGVSRDIRAQLLSHGIAGIQSAHYDRYSYMTEKRNTLLAWERWLESL